MRLTEPVLRIPKLACIAAFLALSGCGGKAPGPAPSNTDATDAQVVANCIKVLSPPSEKSPLLLNEQKLEGIQRRAVKQLESMGSRAKVAIPALEKFGDSTPNADLRKAAVEALAKIQK